MHTIRSLQPLQIPDRRCTSPGASFSAGDERIKMDSFVPVVRPRTADACQGSESRMPLDLQFSEDEETFNPLQADEERLFQMYEENLELQRHAYDQHNTEGRWSLEGDIPVTCGDYIAFTLDTEAIATNYQNLNMQTQCSNLGPNTYLGLVANVERRGENADDCHLAIDVLFVSDRLPPIPELEGHHVPIRNLLPRGCNYSNQALFLDNCCQWTSLGVLLEVKDVFLSDLPAHIEQELCPALAELCENHAEERRQLSFTGIPRLTLFNALMEQRLPAKVTQLLPRQYGDPSEFFS